MDGTCESKEIVTGVVEEPDCLGALVEIKSLTNGISNDKSLHDSPCPASLEQYFVMRGGVQ